MHVNTLLLLLFSLLNISQGALISLQSTYRPVVLWHGLGDSGFDDRSMGHVAEIIREKLPGIYVKLITFGDSESQDRQASYFGDVNQQLSEVCAMLEKDAELVHGFNAIGFSQGGAFMRGYVERCNSPRVYNLITFGSPHGGAAEAPNCDENNDLWCDIVRSIIRRNVYGEWAQTHVIPAQYFKDPEDLPTYVEQSAYLADINNEREFKNVSYAEGIRSLNFFVLIKFTEDTTLIPSNSAWFEFYDNNDRNVTLPLRQQPIYVEDWIGLKTLDSLGRLFLKTCIGKHMHIPMDYFEKEIIWPYLDNKVTHWKKKKG